MTNVDGADVTFTYPEMEATDQIVFDGAISQCRVTFAYSTASTYGYVVDAAATNCLYAEATGVGVAMSFTVPIAPLLSLDLNDFYDDTILKGIPPKLRYIDIFANQLVAIATKDNEIADTLY